MDSLDRGALANGDSRQSRSIGAGIASVEIRKSRSYCTRLRLDFS